MNMQAIRVKINANAAATKIASVIVQDITDPYFASNDRVARTFASILIRCGSVRRFVDESSPSVDVSRGNLTSNQRSVTNAETAKHAPTQASPLDAALSETSNPHDAGLRGLRAGNSPGQTSFLGHSPTRTGVEASQPDDNLLDRPTVLSQRTQVILLRYFMQDLAPRFDICDPHRYCERYLPRRANESPVLRNAMFTFAARSLVRSHTSHETTPPVKWQGHTISDLTIDTPVLLHNECIRDLLRLSMDQEQTRNVDLLAASILLRSDEEIDAPFRGVQGEEDLFLRVTNVFLEAQIPTLLMMSPSSDDVIVQPNRITQRLLSPLSVQLSAHGDSEAAVDQNTLQFSDGLTNDTLRQSCFWIALRQELHRAVMTQNSLVFSMISLEEFRVFSPAQDHVWAHRAVVLAADIVEYCFGGRDNSTTPSRDLSAWHTLQLREQALKECLPATFEPLYFEQDDPANGSHFPEVWYQNSTHVLGGQYLRLAEILLLSHDPTISVLGQGAKLKRQQLGNELKSLTLIMCGIAICNRQVTPAFLNACTGIVLCGEYFEGKAEQDAILYFLELTEDVAVYPTRELSFSLKQAWGR
ncbi:hypothetical protein K461DRAFT_312990 [Myriangium duriaei CBS 260.36]|uniref:Uncharacterized protein n=1 Tax=Myriangium duriaei CBS 260.36 TaxID=1168546 RepID=A0A9P4IZ41_9PEZI|nr:hypothetical protein K461DRAFT_312990 [Myriangium duriaei CBS 260.36]